MEVLQQVRQQLNQENLSVLKDLKSICNTLKNRLQAYDWVGFYFADFKSKMLHLKAYSGAPTEHTSIPFGKGICGQVALSNKNFMVPDVTAQDNYIACSIDVQSELVVPLFLEGKNIGQIDIDSKFLNPFTKEDETFLTEICSLVSSTYGKSLKQI
jgi:GAF domain-containing protein